MVSVFVGCVLFGQTANEYFDLNIEFNGPIKAISMTAVASVSYFNSCTKHTSRQGVTQVYQSAYPSFAALT